MVWSQFRGAILQVPTVLEVHMTTISFIVGKKYIVHPSGSKFLHIKSGSILHPSPEVSFQMFMLPTIVGTKDFSMTSIFVPPSTNISTISRFVFVIWNPTFPYISYLVYIPLIKNHRTFVSPPTTRCCYTHPKVECLCFSYRGGHKSFGKPRVGTPSPSLEIQRRRDEPPDGWWRNGYSYTVRNTPKIYLSWWFQIYIYIYL